MMIVLDLDLRRTETGFIFRKGGSFLFENKVQGGISKLDCTLLDDFPQHLETRIIF